MKIKCPDCGAEFEVSGFVADPIEAFLSEAPTDLLRAVAQPQPPLHLHQQITLQDRSPRHLATLTPLRKPMRLLVPVALLTPVPAEFFAHGSLAKSDRLCDLTLGFPCLIHPVDDPTILQPEVAMVLLHCLV